MALRMDSHLYFLPAVLFLFSCVLRVFGIVNLNCTTQTVCRGKQLICFCSSDDGLLGWHLPSPFESKSYLMSSELECMTQKEPLEDKLSSLSICLLSKDNGKLKSQLIVWDSDTFVSKHFICSGSNSSSHDTVKFIREEIPNTLQILTTVFEPPNAIITLNTTEIDIIVDVNNSYSIRATGPVVYINLSDFAVGEDVLLVVSAINRCEETSEGWSNTSVRVSVTNSNSYFWIISISTVSLAVILLLTCILIFCGVYCNVLRKRSDKQFRDLYSKYVELQALPEQFPEHLSNGAENT